MSATGQGDIAAALRQVRAEIRQACERSGRDPDTVKLVAASKTFGAEVVSRAIDCGQLVFGENYVQEAKAKWPAIREQHPEVELHLIGPLQSNKARAAVELFDVIQSLDRPSLAQALARQCEKQGRRPAVFVQVNTGSEPQKAGVPPAEVDRFLEECRDRFGLTVTGLMCIPPAGQPPDEHFRMLTEIAERNSLKELSMGMSGDYVTAIMHGATCVRIGSAIFGRRQYAAAQHG